MERRHGKGAFGQPKRLRSTIKVQSQRKAKLEKMAAPEHGLRSFLGDLRYKEHLDRENNDADEAEDPRGMDMSGEGEAGPDEAA